MRLNTLSIAGLSLAILGSANADVESSISVGYNSDYVYRGLNLGEDQVSFNLGASGAAAGLDWNVGLFQGTSQFDGGSLDETRIHAGISKSLSDLIDVNVGAISTSYNTLGTGGDRLEIYVGAGTNIGGIDLSATAFFNTQDEWSGDVYYELGASYSVDLAEGISGTVGVTYGNWDEDPFFIGLEDVDFVSFSGTLNFSLSDNIGASVGVSHVVSDTAATEDETVVGTSLSIGF
jgi:hypothetical protein